jgi:hypothetical protein
MQKNRPTEVSERAKEGELIVLGILQVVLTICGNVLGYLRFLLF